MCEVTSKNFEEKYPQIIDDLHASCFLSIDCEFSGLFNNNNKYSLFDTPEERHRKLQENLKEFSIIQFGLSTFKYDTVNNCFNTTSYTFYLMPSSFLRTQSKVTYDLESIDFLCNHKFDFNKVFNEGISYLNQIDESKLVKMILDDNINITNKEVMEKYFFQIQDWLLEATEKSEMVFNLNQEKEVFILCLHLEIRKSFSNIWTYYDESKIMKIKKVSELKRNDLIQQKENLMLKKKLIDSILGFSRIMKEIEGLKKPIIGHNCLADLIMLYKQFYNPSFISYKDFKSCITRIFPIIYDTKNISYTLRELLSKDNAWKSNFLSDLYHYFKNGRGATLVLFTPLINHKSQDFVETERFHEAGFDSYCTGFCFVKMAYVFSLWNPEKKTFDVSSMRTTSSWLLAAVAPMKNHINITRGQVNNIVLDGPDPKSTRPNFLYVQSTNNQPLDISKINEITEKSEALDIQPVSRFAIIIAPGNQKIAKELIEHLKQHPEFKVTTYNFIKHSDLGKIIIAGTVFASAILWLILNLKTAKNTILRKLI